MHEIKQNHCGPQPRGPQSAPVLRTIGVEAPSAARNTLLASEYWPQISVKLFVKHHTSSRPAGQVSAPTTCGGWVHEPETPPGMDMMEVFDGRAPSRVSGE